MNKVIVTSFGTMGDVLPFIALGQQLRRRGHRVVFVGNERFQKEVSGTELKFEAVGTEEDYRRALENGAIWDEVRGLKAVMNSLIPDPVQTYDRIAEHIDPGRTVLVSHPFSLAPRLVQEKMGVPGATAVLSPCLLRSNYRVPVMYGDLEVSTMARPLKRLMWYLADRFLIDPAVCPVLNRARRRLGMDAVDRPFDGWMFSPELTIGLFPTWFAPRQPDWPEEVCLAGFPLFDLEAAVPPEVEAFIDDGPAPVVATCGSAVSRREAFSAAVVEACRRTGRRALFLGFEDAVAERIADEDSQFLAARFAPLRAILKHCQAIIHHGGIGTVAAALEAGIPQIVRPIAHDHPDHAARVQRLGIGTRLLAKEFTPENLSAALERLLHTPEVIDRCRNTAGQAAAYDGVATSCELIEATFDMGRRDRG